MYGIVVVGDRTGDHSKEITILPTTFACLILACDIETELEKQGTVHLLEFSKSGMTLGAVLLMC
jgi:hypothetical protein